MTGSAIDILSLSRSIGRRAGGESESSEREGKSLVGKVIRERGCGNSEMRSSLKSLVC